MADIRFKKGVSIYFTSEIILMIEIISDILYKMNLSCVITSGNDGEHGENSLHQYNKAIDIRLTWIDNMTPFIIAEFKKELGNNYDIVKEKDHIHIEYDPKNIPLKNNP